MANSFDLTDLSNLFKETYGPLSENVYNSANVVLGRVKKSFDFTGRQRFIPIPQSFQGGVGSGSLPTANSANVEDAIITANKVYSVVRIDREAMKAASDDRGSFVRGTRWVVQKGVESWMRNLSRILFNDGTGAIADGDGSTNVTGAGTTGDPYIVVLDTDTKEANVEEADFWNFNSETTNLEVISYVPSTRTVTLVGTSTGLGALTGANPVAQGVFFHMQGSKDNDPEGLRGVLTAVAGTKYSVPITRRWQAGTNQASGGAGITTDMLNEDMLEIQRTSGKVPKMIVTSFTQYRKILNLLEDQKRYTLEPRAANLKGKVSFDGVSYMSAAGEIPIFPERFVASGEVYYLNDDHIEIYHRPGFGGQPETSRLAA